jgi:FMN phosphatase YigB (HAD superfamily)
MALTASTGRRSIMTNLVVDVDDTILQWKEGFFEFIEAKGWYRDPNSACDSWDIWTWICDSNNVQVSKELVLELIIEFNSYPRVLKPISGSKSYLELLWSEGITIIALTSFGSCPVQTKFRKEYLNVVFDEIFSDVIVLPLGACKKEALKLLEPDYFVEDNKAHAQVGCELGIKTFLLNTTYNQGCEKSVYVESWGEIYFNILADLEGKNK